jgi:hypothetical protein
MRRKYYQIYQDQYEDYIGENKRNFSGREEEYLVRSIRNAIDKWDVKQFGVNKSYDDYEDDFIESEGTIGRGSRYSFNSRLRPDAKLFLLNNFHQMIVKPLINDYNFEMEDINISKMKQECEEDVEVILNKSIEEIEYHENEISGHLIMRIMDRLWRGLNMTRMEVWG